MAVVRDFDNPDTFLTYLSTIALFCGISCTIVMIRFKGFKASLNLTSNKENDKHYEVAPQASVLGAYRTSKDEYFGDIKYLNATKTITPSMVKLPPSTQTHVAGNVKPSKSTGNVREIQSVPTEVRKSTPNVSVQNIPPGATEAKIQSKAQKKLEKEQLIEQKKREKLAAQEREKQEKLRKEREKQQAKEAKEREKQRKKKWFAPRPTPQTTIEQKSTPKNTTDNNQTDQRARQHREAPQPPQFQKVTQGVQPNANLLSQNHAQNSRNSLESSISRSSGPPPYTANSEIVPNNDDNTGNTSFAKPADVGSSWDMISQHRQQMTRTAGANIHNSKQKNMDLRYNVGNLTNDGKDNSEA